MVKIKAHDSEVITCDWSRYDKNVVASGAVDGRIKGWDLRNTSAPCFDILVSHLLIW